MNGIKKIVVIEGDFDQINTISSSHKIDMNPKKEFKKIKKLPWIIILEITTLKINKTNKTGANCLNFKDSGWTERVFVFHKPYLKNCFINPNKELLTK